MNLDNSFNPKRFFNIVKTEVLPAYKSALITFAAVGGLLLIINVSSVGSWDRWNMHMVFYPITMFLVGLLTTSFTFKDMHSKTRGYAYLTLPGSSFEKYTAKLLLTGIGMVIATMVMYFVVSAVSAGLTRLIFGMNHRIFNPFEVFYWKLVAQYIIAHSVFFLGAVFFKKLSFLKTILSLTVFSFGLNILIGIIYGIMFLFTLLSHRGDGGSLWNFTWLTNWSMFDGLAEIRKYEVLFRILLMFYYFVLPPFLWVTGYFRYTEKEAR